MKIPIDLYWLGATIPNAKEKVRITIKRIVVKRIVKFFRYPTHLCDDSGVPVVVWGES